MKYGCYEWPTQPPALKTSLSGVACSRQPGGRRKSLGAMIHVCSILVSMIIAGFIAQMIWGPDLSSHCFPYSMVQSMDLQV